MTEQEKKIREAMAKVQEKGITIRSNMWGLYATDTGFILCDNPTKCLCPIGAVLFTAPEPGWERMQELMAMTSGVSVEKVAASKILNCSVHWVSAFTKGFDSIVSYYLSDKEKQHTSAWKLGRKLRQECFPHRKELA